MFDYKPTGVTIKPVMVDNFDIGKLKFVGDNNTFINISYNDNPFYLQTPVLTVDKVCCGDDDFSFGYIIFVDDDSDGFKKLCNVFKQIQNERLKYNIFRNDQMNKCNNLLKIDDNGKIYWCALLESFNTTRLDTSLFVNDSVNIPKLYKCEKSSDFKKLLPKGSKIRMVMLIDHGVEYDSSSNIVNIIMLIEKFV